MMKGAVFAARFGAETAAHPSIQDPSGVCLPWEHHMRLFLVTTSTAREGSRCYYCNMTELSECVSIFVSTTAMGRGLYVERNENSPRYAKRTPAQTIIQRARYLSPGDRDRTVLRPPKKCDLSICFSQMSPCPVQGAFAITAHTHAFPLRQA
jgi:hypothetical protein